jgi:23S rRNA (uridine2552-2'-O)-methyltransferase
MTETAKPKKKKILKHNTKFDNKKLSTSSRRYLERQAGDMWSEKARKEGYRSRAAYKIAFIDAKHTLIRPGRKIVDLGAAPGGWSQYAARKLGAKASIIALDKLEIEPIANVTLIQGDFNDDAVFDHLLTLCPEGVDVVLSDLAPETSGVANLDHLRSIQLCEMALDFALRTLRPGGDFVCKIFMGGEEKKFMESLRQHFDKSKFEKPEASRAESKEVFIVATGFKG